MAGGVHVSLGEARAKLGDESLGLLWRCHARAEAIYNGHISGLIPLCSRDRLPSILHELIIEEARHAFADIPHVQVHDPSSLGRFLLESRGVIVQFKKLSRQFATANNPTDTSRAWDGQQMELGLPPYARLTAGYQLDEYETRMKGIYLAFIRDGQCIWWHDLRSGEHSIALDFPPPDPRISPAELERQAAHWAEMNRQVEERE